MYMPYRINERKMFFFAQKNQICKNKNEKKNSTKIMKNFKKNDYFKIDQIRMAIKIKQTTTHTQTLCYSHCELKQAKTFS